MISIDPNQQFYYRCSMAWPVNPKEDDAFGQIDVSGTPLVHKVRHEAGNYVFEFVDQPGVEYSSYYGWAFVFATEIGKLKLDKVKTAEEQRKIVEEKYGAALKQLPTIESWLRIGADASNNKGETNVNDL